MTMGGAPVTGTTHQPLTTRLRRHPLPATGRSARSRRTCWASAVSASPSLTCRPRCTTCRARPTSTRRSCAYSSRSAWRRRCCRPARCPRDTISSTRRESSLFGFRRARPADRERLAGGLRLLPARPGTRAAGGRRALPKRRRLRGPRGAGDRADGGFGQRARPRPRDGEERTARRTGCWAATGRAR